MKLLRIGTETSEARVDVAVDDDVRTQRAVEKVPDVDDLFVAGRRMARLFLAGMRAVQQLAAQGGSAFDGSMEPLDDHGAVLGVGLEIEQAQAAVDYGKQVAEVVGVGLSRVTFDLWGAWSGKSTPVFLQSTPVILPSAPSSGTSTQAKPEGDSSDCRATRAERSTTSSSCERSDSRKEVRSASGGCVANFRKVTTDISASVVQIKPPSN